MLNMGPRVPRRRWIEFEGTIDDSAPRENAPQKSEARSDR
jgi:hypothetical protein